MLLLCLAPLLLLVLPVRAQLSDDRFEAYTSMRQINRVLVHQDAVWAGTSGGVLRYDQQTQSYARFTRRDGLPGNLILSLAVDANGHLWFGTHSQGLSRYRPEEDRFDSPFLDFQNLRINALEPHGDILYVGSERGVSAFVISKEEVKETYRRLGSLAKDTEVTSIEVFADRLWAGTVNGLVWADLDQPNLQDPSSWELELTRGEVRDMLVYQDTLFVAASNGIWRVHPALDSPELDDSTSSVALGLFEGSIVSATTDGLLFQRQGVDHWQPLRAPHIRSAADLSDTDGPLWVASASGLRVLGIDQPPPPREPVGNFFFDMAQTPNGHLWVASVPKDNLRAFAFGLYEFDGDGWTTHNTNTNLSSNIVSALETDAEGLLWVGTWGRGIDVRAANGQWQNLDANNSALEGIDGNTFVAISDIDRDANGLLWIANVRNGLVVMDGWPPQRATLNSQLDFGMSAGRDMTKIAIGPDDLKWVGTASDGFFLLDDGGTPFETGDEIGFTFDTAAYPSLTSDTVIDIHVDRSGRVWVATNNGLNAVRGEYSRPDAHFAVESWKVYNADNGLPNTAVTSLAEDDWGRIWVGTEGGLVRIDTEGQVEFALDTSDGLVNNRVNSLYFDRENDALWIGTLAGMSRLQLGVSGAAAGPQAYAYPNPFHIGVRGASLTFADLPLGAGVRIFTAAGELIRQLDGAAGEGAVTWNGQSAAGFLVGSGIYYFVAQAETGNAVRGKFAVINSR
ncbi:MAG: hypothetical protein OXH81_09575 [Gemmatimonadetes bacterium]|nr:hypothetical protein [Gemmatimonadota bacterium]MDE2733864.1 hypothetical protein [Gemmatimonadota bacterium]